MGKLGKNIPALTAFAVLILGLSVCGAIANTTNTVSKTVREMPGEIVEARATGTAIALVNEPTAMYIATVVPVVQVEEAKQATATTKNRGEWQRVIDTAKSVLSIAWRVVGLALALSAIVAIAGIGAMAAVGALTVVIALACWAWERYKRAQEFVPYQVLPDRALLLPGWQVHVDSRTGRQTNIRTEYPAIVDHGHLLIERQIASHKPGMVENIGNTINQAMGAIGRYWERVHVQVRNGERHPQTEREVAK